MELKEIINGLGSAYKIVLSKPRKDAKYKKISISSSDKGYIAESFTDKQAFSESISKDALSEYIYKTSADYMQINAWSDDLEHIILISKKGHITYKKKQSESQPVKRTEHNRKKQYLIEEGTVIPPLVDMGIFTSEGKVVRSMYDKFRQINRFIELIHDEIKSRGFKSINIIDFGCGKSYLTFIVYYYLTEVMNIDTHIIGLDLKADVIAACNAAAKRYGYDGLKFEVGDINGYTCEVKPDMVITLHACDTATDYALYNAINWGAKLIFSIPCCQHELNAQMKSDRLSILTRYGIIKERTAALMTDAIRGNLLKYMGYSVQLLEFVDMSHTPKNILIRAVKTNVSEKARMEAMSEVRSIISEFGFDPALYRLLERK